MSKSQWRECKLGDILELKRGYDLPSHARKEGDVPIVSSSGISGVHNEPRAKAPGVVTGRYGTIGQVFYITKDFWPLNTSLYVSDFKGNNPRFISYLLQTIDFFAYSDKAAVPGVNRNHLHEARIRIPDMKSQEIIVQILSSFEDKIELNNQTNNTLESITKAIFKEWFIDFGPVKAKVEGKKPFGMDDETAALFPNGFQESELGTIPKGWKPGKLGSIAEVIGGGTPSTSESSFYCQRGEGISWLSPKDLSGYTWKYIEGGATDITESGLKNSSARLMPAGAVLFSSRAPIGYVAVAERELSTNQGFKSLIPTNGSNSEFLYYLAKANVDLIEARASGSTFREISGNGMKEIPVVIPTEQIMTKFQEQVEIFSRVQKEIRHESNTLIQLRNALLPKLISGELSLNDV